MEAQAGLVPSRRAWWSAQRKRYNIALVVAGPVSLLSFLGVWGLFEERLPCLEITGFNLGAWIILSPLALGLANVCYLLGPLSERVIRPRNPSVFRHWMLGAGIAFSLVLMFLPVAVTLTDAVLGLPCTDEFGETHVPAPK